MNDSIHQCARAILDTTPAIVQAMRVEMRAERLHELSVPQFRTLAFIGRHPGCSLSDVAEFIGMTLPSMSVLVNGLVEDDLVLRQPCRIDRRRVTLTLTAAGVTVHTRALDGTLAWLTRQLSPLSELDRVTVLRAMDILRPIFDASQVAATTQEATTA